MTSARSFPSSQGLFMLLALLVVTPVLLIPTKAHASASRSPLPTDTVAGPGSFLPGLGTADPPRPNLSTQSSLAEYEWNVPFTNGGKVYQVNSRVSGKVVAIVTVLPKGTYFLSPFPGSRSPAEAECPCTSTNFPLPGGGGITIVRGSAGDVVAKVVTCPSGESCKLIE